MQVGPALLGGAPQAVGVLDLSGHGVDQLGALQVPQQGGHTLGDALISGCTEDPSASECNEAAVRIKPFASCLL